MREERMKKKYIKKATTKKRARKRRRKLSAAEKHILLGRSGMYVFLLGGVNSICILNYEICPLF